MNKKVFTEQTYGISAIQSYKIIPKKNNLQQTMLYTSRLINNGLNFIDSAQKKRFVSYQEFFVEALKTLNFLQKKLQLQKGSHLMIIAEDPYEFIKIFWGCLLGNIIPVPLNIRYSEMHYKKLCNIFEILDNPAIIIPKDSIVPLMETATNEYSQELAKKIKAKVITPQEIILTTTSTDISSSEQDDIAYLQFSSGSTGQPKGIKITHKNVMVNCQTIHDTLGLTKEDSFLSWLPLSHDMGLICFHLTPFIYGLTQSHLLTTTFVRNPGLWLEKAAELKATVLGSPNFGFQHTLRYFSPTDFKSDLKNIRLILNGAEPISRRITDEFLKTMKTYGLSSFSICPTYGLAEATLAVTCNKPGTAFRAICIDRRKVSVGDAIKFCEPKNGFSSEIVDVGYILKPCKLRIVDYENISLEQGRVGLIQLNGPNITPGYLDKKQNITSFTADNWLNTGDIGFLWEDRLFILGREKDIIFINGQNYYASDLENLADTLSLKNSKGWAIAGTFNPDTQKEEILFFMSGRYKPEESSEIAQKIKELYLEQDLVISKVLFIKSLPRTTSGKVQRHILIQNYLNGAYQEPLQKEVSSYINPSVVDTVIVRNDSKTEKILLTMWGNIFQKNNIQITDNFFELGGSSLQAFRLVYELSDKLGISLKSGIIHEYPNIKEMAKHIDTMTAGTDLTQSGSTTEIKHENFNLLPLQQTFYEQTQRTGLHPYILIDFTVSGTARLDLWTTILGQIPLRFQTLGTAIHKVSGLPQQHIPQNILSRYGIHDLGNIDPLQQQNQIDWLIKDLCAQDFDMEKGIFAYSLLIKTSFSKVRMLLYCAHAAIDGLSAEIMVSQILAWYNCLLKNLQYPLPSKNYFNYLAGLERQLDQNKSIESGKDYWQNKLSCWNARLAWPVSVIKPANPLSALIKTREQIIEQSVVTKLVMVAKKHQVSPASLLITMLANSLETVTGQQEIIINTPVANRKHLFKESVECAGCFADVYPLQVNHPLGLSLPKLTRHFQNELVNIMAHSDFPGRQVIKLFNDLKQTNVRSLSDLVFVFLEQPLLESDSLKLDQLALKTGDCDTAIILNVIRLQETLTCFWNYRCDCLDEETIDILTGCFSSQLANLEKENLSFSGEEQHILPAQGQQLISNHVSNKLIAAGPKEYYEVSSEQKRLYFLQTINPDQTNYNLSAILKLDGKPNYKRFKTSLKKLIDRHEGLRTSFHEIEGNIVQKIHKTVMPVINKIILKNLSMEKYFEGFQKAFRLDCLPLFRLELVKDENNVYLLFDIHHIITDAQTLNTLIKDFICFYNGNNPEPLDFSYKDYAYTQSQFYLSSAFKAQEKFWLDKFSTEIPILNFPSDFSRPAKLTMSGERLDFKIDDKLFQKVKEYTVKNKLSPYIFFMGIFSLLLSKYSQQESLIIGSTISSLAKYAELTNIIGMFANTLAIPIKPGYHLTIEQFYNELRRCLFEVYDYMDYPFDRLVNELKLNRENNRNPLFDVIFSYNRLDFSILEQLPFKVNFVKQPVKRVKFDLSLEINEQAGETGLSWEYSTELFKPEKIIRINNHFLHLLRQVLNGSPDTLLKDIELITPKEKKQILHEFNNTAAPYPKDKTIHQLFEKQVELNPTNIAVVFEDQRLTYSELNARANQYAHILRDKGVKPDSIVALMIDRSLEMIIAVLAILKAGGAYLPIDPTLPEARIADILQDSAAHFLLSKETLVQQKSAETFKSTEIIFMNNIEFGKNTGKNLPVINKSTDLAYIIYTSGTTGKPKGVMIEHKGVINLCFWHNNYFTIKDKIISACFSNFQFDAFVWEILPYLINGSVIHLLSEKNKLDPISLNNYFKKNVINICFLPTQICKEFVKLNNTSLKLLLTGGEALTNVDNKNNYQIINNYGPTENTVVSTFFRLNKSFDPIPIGRPINNTAIYIFNKTNQLMPIGVPGELFVGGDGLARGYLNRPDMTTQKFINNPLDKTEKLYKTGDLGFWSENGEIIFMGRADNQVKIRGFRIECGEIEAYLLKYPQLTNVFVTALEFGNNDKRLCAYFTATKILDRKEIKNFLSKRLPSYMVPAYFIQLENFPLNRSGKIDTKQLPRPDSTIKKITSTAIFTSLELKIRKIWENILQNKNISPDDNFFEIGGNSLLAIKLVSQLQPYGNLGLTQIFELPTIRKQANHIESSKTAGLQERVKHFYLNMLRFKKYSSGKHDTKILIADKQAAYYQKVNSMKISVTGQEKNYQKVLLTGGTGFLGTHLLYELLIQKDCEIFLPVRGKDQNEAEARLKQKLDYYFSPNLYQIYKSRLRVICSDLTQPEMGINSELYAKMCSEVEAIYHTAADVRHYGPYEQFYKSNVLPTEALIDFAKQGLIKDIHHISSMGLAIGEIKDTPAYLFTEFDQDCGQKIANNYVRSKLEAEKRIEQAGKDGLKAYIYRVGNIFNHSTSGKFQENIASNAFYSFFSSALKIGHYYSEACFEFNLSAVDEISKALLCLSTREHLPHHCFHIFNPNTLMDKNIWHYLETFYNWIQPLSLPDFCLYILKNYHNKEYQQDIENILLIAESHLGKTCFMAASEYTQNCLAHFGFSWQKVGREQIIEMIKTMQQSGLFNNTMNSKTVKEKVEVLV
ncbi:MAG: amino acid adenylation domain-containing protein [Candidatus Margulisbacteria bacterium]|nr:amino acid adenylation domain-containing protein [Candidatus Margulisiibacteriota bacterium]